MSEWKDFALQFVTNDENPVIKSSHALEWLADVYADEKGQGIDEAIRMLTLLKEKYDPVRTNYWDYRIRMVSATA